MTDSSAMPDPAQRPVQAYGPARPPGVVYAAVTVTWLAATLTGGMILFLIAGLLWLGDPLFDAFASGPDDPRWYLLGFGAVIAAFAALADVAGYFVLHRRRWALLVLLALCAVAALAGVMTAYYVAPLLVTAAAVGVAVMLLTPAARAWCRTPRGL